MLGTNTSNDKIEDNADFSGDQGKTSLRDTIRNAYQESVNKANQESQTHEAPKPDPIAENIQDVAQHGYIHTLRKNFPQVMESITPKSIWDVIQQNTGVDIRPPPEQEPAWVQWLNRQLSQNPALLGQLKLSPVRSAGRETTYGVLNEGGGNVGNLVAYHSPGNPSRVYVDTMSSNELSPYARGSVPQRANAGSGTFGHKDTMSIFEELAKKYPEADVAQGVRMTGARYGDNSNILKYGSTLGKFPLSRFRKPPTISDMIKKMTE